jgi:hypothetical protein
MTDEEKQKFCDKLISDGIAGRSDEDSVTRVTVLTDLAIEVGHKAGVACALQWYETLEKMNIGGESAIKLDFGKANAIAGERYGTQWTWHQPSLAREIFYLRRAVSNPAFGKVPKDLRCICLSNLGNRMSVAGRAIEALDYWRRTIELQPNFGMALCNRARILTEYARALDDKNFHAPFLWVAHLEASKALSPTAVYTDPAHDRRTQERTRQLMEWIESVFDVKAIDTLGDPLACPDRSSSKEEQEYRSWCLANGLFLNPLNDLGEHRTLAADTLELPSLVVQVDSPHRFESFFDQMKQEYVSARWSFYEGTSNRQPHFSDRDVLLQLTDPRPSLSFATERIKGSYRAAYSLFDKISFFVNAYMELGIREKDVSFRRLWRSDEKKPIRSEFDQSGNWGFCALYWLSRDLFEKENDDVAEPQARGLSEIRNHLEHKYLRVTAGGSALAPPDDLAFMVSREDLESKALHLLKLSRSALIYLAVGCKFEEDRRKPRCAGLPIEDLPPVPYLTDDEKK